MVDSIRMFGRGREEEVLNVMIMTALDTQHTARCPSSPLAHPALSLMFGTRGSRSLRPRKKNQWQRKALSKLQSLIFPLYNRIPLIVGDKTIW